MSMSSNNKQKVLSAVINAVIAALTALATALGLSSCSVLFS